MHGGVVCMCVCVWHFIDNVVVGVGQVLAKELLDGCEWRAAEAVADGVKDTCTKCDMFLKGECAVESLTFFPLPAHAAARVRFMIGGIGMFVEELLTRNSDMMRLRNLIRSSPVW